MDACALDAVLDGGDAEPPREKGAQAARRTGGPGHTRVRGHQPHSLPNPLQIGRVGAITVPTGPYKRVKYKFTSVNLVQLLFSI